MTATAAAPDETSFPKSRIRVLLMENVHESAHEVFRHEGFQVETHAGALDEDALLAKLRDVHVLGIRSRTQVTDRALSEARRLLTLGAFCIGTNQIDLEAASQRGVPVFNAPFSNTRSVAELVMAEIIALARRLVDRSREMHEGRWRKGASSSYEVRGKTLGIVGYGHIGTQVGVLAEAVGMQVLFHDIAPKLPMGNNRQAVSLEAVLGQADFVTLHVPETPLTRNLIGERELARMKPGAYLLNLSRGSVVDVGALARALRSGHLSGAAADVFPTEPDGDSDEFTSELRGDPQRHPDPACRRLDQGSAGRDRPRGRERPGQVHQHGGDDGLGELPARGASAAAGPSPPPECPPQCARRPEQHQPHRRGLPGQHREPGPGHHARHRLSRHGPQPGGIEGGPAADGRPGAEHPHARPLLAPDTGGLVVTQDEPPARRMRSSSRRSRLLGRPAPRVSSIPGGSASTGGCGLWSM